MVLYNKLFWKGIFAAIMVKYMITPDFQINQQCMCTTAGNSSLKPRVFLGVTESIVA